MTISPLVLLAFRLAARLPRGWGMYPTGFYVRQALAALNVDDLDAAVSCFETARGKDFGDEQVLVLREILMSEIDFRMRKLNERLEVTAEESEREETRKGIALLARFREILEHPRADRTASEG